MAGGIIANLTYAVGFKIASSALKKADKQTADLTKKVLGFGKAAMGVGIAIGGLASTAGGFAARYETVMGQVQMATGATAEQMAETKGIATDLYNQNFGESWSDLGKSIAAVQQITGAQGKELQEMTKSALLMRDAFGIDVSEGIRSAKTMMENFGISADQSFNLIAQGKQKGLDFSGELLDTINEYSLQFKSLGFSANEMFDTLAAGAAEGAFNLDKVADSVKEFNIRAKDGSKTTTDAYKMLGLDAEKMMQTFANGGPEARKSFSQIIQMIGDVKDPVAQNTIAVNLFGTQFEDLQKDVFTAMGSVDSQFDMAIDKMGELNQVKMDSPAQAIGVIGRQLETGLLIPLGQKVLPYLQQFSGWFTENLPQIQSIMETTVNVIVGIFSGFADVLSWTVDHANILLPIMLGLAGAIAAQLIIGKVTKLYKMWQAATVAQTTVQWLLNTAMAANPIGIIALAIGALIAVIVVLIMHWDTVKRVTINVFKSIGSFFMEYWPYALGLLLGPIGLVIAYVIRNWDQVKSVTISVFTSIGDFFKWIWSGIVSGITGAVTGIWDTVTGIWDRVTGFLRGIDLMETGRNIIQGLINGIVNMKDAVIDKVKDIAGGIKDGIMGFLGIHSPSRVMMEVGFYTGEGLAQGIEETKGRVSAASTDLAEEVESPYSYAATAAPSTEGISASPQSGHMQLEINLNITMTASGGAGQQPVSGDVLQQIKQVVQEAVEGAGRRMGVAYGNS